MAEGARFDELESTIPYLRRYARALKRQAEGADDLVQDTLERAIARLDQFQPGTNMRSWTFTLMHNIHIDQCRRARRRKTVPLEEQDEGESPASQMWAINLKSFIESFKRLRRSEQDVIMLVSIKGLKYEEAATQLGVALGTVKSRLFRARANLRAMGCEY